MSDGTASPACGGTQVTVGSSMTSFQKGFLTVAIILGIIGILEHLISISLEQLIVNGIIAGFEYFGYGVYVDVFVVPLSSLPAFVAGAAAVAIAAAATAIIISYWLWSKWWSVSAHSVRLGVLACVSGVVDRIIGPDTDPFFLAHGFIFVVVKQRYWPVVAMRTPAPFVWCQNCQNCPPAVWPAGTTGSNAATVDCSPALPCLYYDKAIVNMAGGEAVGGTIGALAGAIIGTIVGDAILGGLVGCTASGPLYAVCVIAVVLLAVIAAVAIVVVAALAGGAIGYGIASAFSSGGGPGGSQGGQTASLIIGDYVSVTGNLTTVQNLNGSNAIYFAGWIPDATTHSVIDETQNNANGTTIFGMSQGTPPFCHTDPDQNIPDSTDDSCFASNPSN